ncbi:MAG: polynucleotide adenylyltransferase PcnB [Deltaproteobacteria bacterium]|uniref:Poly(A) polymerase I n=1 Tax=Candidatus Zymogenus saltonus TaxID=2844893 RepID=A0A9D8KF56_9DELT|nr:polynucleotide adenylyltransferase PcnB [Candidatus Zymogenus saltonus]
MRLPFAKSKETRPTTAQSTPLNRETVILTRDKHPISRKNIDQNALKVLYRLHNHGYKAYLVGGSVRDLLMGRKPKDFDIGTDATPREIKRLFANSLIIGRRFKIVHVRFKGNDIVEVTTFRKKSEEEISSNGLPTSKDNTFGTPIEDAFRRDLTINGLFYNIADFTVIDHVGGIKDIEEGIVRVIGDPEERFAEDPVRITRAIRHSARTGFTIAEETERAIRKMSESIALCSSHRIQEEILKDLRSGYSREAFRLFREYGILNVLFPYVCESIEKTDITEEMVLTALGLLDNLVKSGVEPSVAFLLAVPMIPSTITYINKTVSENNGGGIDIPRLIQRHLSESLKSLEISKGNIDTMKSLLYLNWKLLRNLDKGFIPPYLTKKNHFHKAFNLLGISARVFGYFTDSQYPPTDNDTDPLRSILKPPRRKSRRKSSPKKSSPPLQKGTDHR